MSRDTIYGARSVRVFASRMGSGSASIGLVIGSRISSVLETVLRFGCGVAVIGVAIQVVSHVAKSYRTLADAGREEVKDNLEALDRNNNAKRAEYHAQVNVQWHVEILSALVMMGIFIVACELAVGDFTESLIQSLSVGIGFGLKEIMQDAVYGAMAMMQGYGKKDKIMNIKPDSKTTPVVPDIGMTTSTQTQDGSAKSRPDDTRRPKAATQIPGYRVYQAHLTHVVLRPCFRTSTTDQNNPVTYVVKRWTEFYNDLRFTE